MPTYTPGEKTRLIDEIRALPERFGPPPLTNVDLERLEPNDVDVFAVGSLVYRKNGNVVLVRRRETPGEWLIPGGGVDPGEDILASVTREVREETGLDSVVDGLLRIGWAPAYSPPAFREVNRRRYGKDSVGLLFVNFRGVESSGQLDCSLDPERNILEVREFRELPFDKITYVYRVLFVQQGLSGGCLADYDVAAFDPPTPPTSDRVEVKA